MKQKPFIAILFMSTGLILALMWLMSGGVGTAVHAATFTVNSTADAIDTNPGDGNCATAGGTCTLRAAIQEANALTGEDTITLPAGTYTLAIAGTDEDAAATGDLDINDSLIINGAGSSNTIIDGNQLDRVFQTTAVTTLTGMTIQNGQVNDPSIFACGGGAIHVGDSFTIQNSVITNNSTINSSGGGLCLMAYLDEITIMNSTISHNSAGGYPGGGIHSIFSSNVSLINSTVSNNSAASGGGISYYSGNGQTVLGIEMSQIISNTALGGSGVDFRGNDTVLEIIASTFEANQIFSYANSSGAGLAIMGDSNSITIRDSIFRHNTSDAHNGGGIANWSDNTTISLIGTTFNGNTAVNNNGGAYWSEADNVTLNIIDGIFTDNNASQYGGAIYSKNFTDTIAITNTHFTNNAASLDGSSGGAQAFTKVG